MVTTKGGSGTQQLATTRDAQAPKHKDMRSTTVGGGGGGVWHGMLVRRGVEEGGGRPTGGGCSSYRLIVLSSVEERSSTKDTKEAVEKSSSWFPLPWGWVSFRLLSVTERKQESF